MLKLSKKSFLLAVCLITACFACKSSGQWPVVSGQRDDQPGQQVSNETATWLLKQARARLSRAQSAPALNQQSAPRQTVEPRRSMIFVTAFVRGRALWPRAAIGRGASLHAALNAALDSINGDAANQGAVAPPDRIQIDIIEDGITAIDRPGDVSNLAHHSKLRAVDLIEAGAEGLEVESGARSLYLLPSEAINKSIFAEDAQEQKADDFLDRAMVELGLARGAWKWPSIRVKKFRAASFVENISRDAAIKLVRGFVPVEQVNRDKLLAAARAGGNYLVRAQRQDGSFYYLYDPLADNFNARAYNIVRHAGTAFCLLELYRATRDRSYLDAARRAVNFLKTRFRPAQSGRGVYVLDNDRKAKLGANGLSLLALALQIELDPQSADRENAKRLANLILALQHKDGSFESYHRVRGDEPEGSVSLYYPGEAILGLTHLYRSSGDNRLLEAARRGADYLIESQRRAGKLPPDAWLMQALEALLKEESNSTQPASSTQSVSAGRRQKYAEHAIALAQAMIADQYTVGAPAGCYGGFGPGLPRATPAASRAEGLLAAYRIARSISDARASKIADAIKACAQFQLSQQLDAENSFFLPNAERAAGGFRASLTSMRIRIDFVQHNVSSLLGAAETLY